MATFRYFRGETELKMVRHDGHVSTKAKHFYGLPMDQEPVYTKEFGWETGFVAADRKIEFKKRPDGGHKCDDRCMNAKGFKCECECGGKNHGRGIVCE